MATGILGLGSSGASGLNQELIDKLKVAESKAKVDTIQADIDKITSLEENNEGEQFKLEFIKAKIADFLDKVKQFDLYNREGNVFEQISASSSGTSVTFSADDAKLLPQGTTKVSITQLAQKTVQQSSTFNSKDGLPGNGTITFTFTKGTLATTDDTTQSITTDGKTYQQIADEVKAFTGVDASIEQVGDGSFRLITRSEESGLLNGFSMVSSVSGFSFSQTLEAKNMAATVDGISYDLSSNQFTVNTGLKINAVSVGESSITIAKNTDNIVPAIDDLVAGYNDLMKTINDELYNAKTPMKDLSTLRMLVSDVKNIFFDQYGANDSLSLFNYGFSFDTNGYMAVDTKVFAKALSENQDELKRLFIGVAEDKGLGTKLKEYIDGLNFTGGLLSGYETSMNARKTKLEAEKEKAQAAIDAKYQLLAEQFASYTAIITQMEASFGGLKMMIQQSTASR